MPVLHLSFRQQSTSSSFFYYLIINIFLINGTFQISLAKMKNINELNKIRLGLLLQRYCQSEFAPNKLFDATIYVGATAIRVAVFIHTSFVQLRKLHGSLF